jgi:serine/threonine protein kinase
MYELGLHERLRSLCATMGVVQAAGLRDFLEPMLDFVPERRATAAEMLQHPWCPPPPPNKGLSVDGHEDLSTLSSPAMCAIQPC